MFVAVYKKPIIADRNFLSGLFPAIVGPVVAASKVGFPVLLAVAAMSSKKGDNIIDSTHTSALTERKDFSLA